MEHRRNSTYVGDRPAYLSARKIAWPVLRPSCVQKISWDMKKNKTSEQAEGRVIGLDAHPDSFTAAILRGPTPSSAIIEKTCDNVPMSQLESWARKNAAEED